MVKLDAFIQSQKLHKYTVIIQMKAIEQYFSMVLFIMLYKVNLTFEPVDEILTCVII